MLQQILFSKLEPLLFDALGFISVILYGGNNTIDTTDKSRYLYICIREWTISFLNLVVHWATYARNVAVQCQNLVAQYLQKNEEYS